MSLNGIEWSNLAAFLRQRESFNSREQEKELTEEEKCVKLWLEKEINKLEEKKLKP